MLSTMHEGTPNCRTLNTEPRSNYNPSYCLIHWLHTRRQVSGWVQCRGRGRTRAGYRRWAGTTWWLSRHRMITIRWRERSAPCMLQLTEISFDAGRRCPRGEGLFAFSTTKAAHLCTLGTGEVILSATTMGHRVFRCCPMRMNSVQQKYWKQQMIRKCWAQHHHHHRHHHHCHHHNQRESVLELLDHQQRRESMEPGNLVCSSQVGAKT